MALVTGAGRGIGRAVAIRLSSEGLTVALTARSRLELDATAQQCSGRTLVVPGDITDPATVEAVFTAVEAQLGPVEVLVANAGAGVSATVARTTDEQWQQMLDLNLTAPFRCLRRALPGMQERRAGRVVVVASIAAKIGEPYIAAYAASKHGVLGLVRSAAAELDGTGVTVNAVCPGYVDTPMTDASVRGIAARTGRSTEEVRAILASKLPSGRLVTPEEVADAVWRCVGDDTLNGAALDVLGVASEQLSWPVGMP